MERAYGIIPYLKWNIGRLCKQNCNEVTYYDIVLFVKNKIYIKRN